MANEKKAPKKDRQVKDLPEKKLSNDDAERVKGGESHDTVPTESLSLNF